MFKLAILFFIFIDLNNSIFYNQRPADPLPRCEPKELDISEFSPRFFNGSVIDGASQFIRTNSEEIFQYKLKENPARTVQVSKIRLYNREEAAQLGFSIAKYLTLSESEEGKVYHSYPAIKKSELCYKTTNFVYFVREAFKAPFVNYYMKFLNKKNEYDSLPWKIYASVHLALRVKRLHEAGYLYTYLNPSTIYVRSDFDMVLGDYRFFKFEYLDEDMPISLNEVAVFNFDRNYIPPELNRGLYSRESDVYSLGLILFTIWAQKTYDDVQSSEEFRIDAINYCNNVKPVTSQDIQTETSIKNVYCRYFHDTVKSMIEYEPEKRLALDDVIEQFKTHTKEAIEQSNKVREPIEAIYKQLKDREKKVKQERIEFRKLTPGRDVKKEKGQYSEIRPIKEIRDELNKLGSQIIALERELDMGNPLEKILEEFFNVMIKPKEREHAYVFRQLSDNQYLFDALKDQGKRILEKPVAEYIANISKQMNDDKKPSLFI